MLQQNWPFCFSRGSDARAPTRRRQSLRSVGEPQISQRRRAPPISAGGMRLAPRERLFCVALTLSGGRISEVLALTPASIDIESGVAASKRSSGADKALSGRCRCRPTYSEELDRVFDLTAAQRDPQLAAKRLWPWSRTTAWRRIKRVMAAAEIAGTPAMPKGLRHGFGVNAFQSSVPPHLVQRWLGHASLRTTAIYGDVVGPDERAFAERMWSERTPMRR